MVNKLYYVGNLGPFLVDTDKEYQPYTYVPGRDPLEQDTTKSRAFRGHQILIEEAPVTGQEVTRLEDFIDITRIAYRYQQSFTLANLVSGTLTIVHDLNTAYPIVTIYNNLKKIILPDNVESMDSSTIKIYLNSFGGIIGTWIAILIG